MSDIAETSRKPDDRTFEIIFTVEGDPEPHSLQLGLDADARDALKAIGKALDRKDLEEISLEDAGTPLPPKVRIADVTADGQILHVSTSGSIEVEVTYSNREVERDFRPSATIGTLIIWAISPTALNLEGDPSDFQLKLGKTILTPDQHLGAIAGGKKKVKLTLVFNVKPQG
jgi:hypothetical protein